MSHEHGSFTKEDLRIVFGLGKKLIKNRVDVLVSEIKHKIDPNIRFARMIKAKYDALIQAGFSKEEAYQLLLKAVEATLKQVTGKGAEKGDEK